MDISAKIDKKAAILGLDIAGYSSKYKLKELSDEELIKLINNHTKSYGVTITLHKPKIAKWIAIMGLNEVGFICSNCKKFNPIAEDECPNCGFKMEEDDE